MKHLIFIIISLILSSCGCKQGSENEFIERGTPESVNIDSELIKTLLSDIESTKIKNIHGLLIIKDDKLVTEKYFNGFNRDRLQYTASVSKSFASALLGIAIDKGFFEDDIKAVLEKRAIELFPELEKTIQKDSVKNGLKLKHILSMTAGFEWDEHSYPYSDSRNDCNRINNSFEPMKFLFERKLIQEPGNEFYYNGGLSLAISYLIERNTNMSVDKFAEKNLFKPLEIDNYQWESVAGGLVDTDGGLHLKPLDQAKLGYLFLNNGIWNGQQVVSKEWVEVSTSMHVNNENMPDYAYQWWGGDYVVTNQSYFMYLASGYGGQKIVVIPGFKTVIVITQQVFDNPFGDLNFITIMSEYILPALTGRNLTSETLKIRGEDLIKFEGHYVSENNNEFVDFSIGDDTLIGISSDGQTNNFIPVSKNTFKTRIMDMIDIYMMFENDSVGNIVSVKSDFAFSNRHFEKR